MDVANATVMPFGHLYPGFPVTLAPGERVTYPILVGNIVWSLQERQGQVVDFVYYVAPTTTRDMSLIPSALRLICVRWIPIPWPDQGWLFYRSLPLISLLGN